LANRVALEAHRLRSALRRGRALEENRRRSDRLQDAEPPRAKDNARLREASRERVRDRLTDRHARSGGGILRGVPRMHLGPSLASQGERQPVRRPGSRCRGERVDAEPARANQSLGVEMDAQEELPPRFVRDLRASRNPYVGIPVAGEHDAHTEAILELRAERAREVQGGFFLRPTLRKRRARITPAVARIDHDRADSMIPAPERKGLELGEYSRLNEVVIIGHRELQTVRAYRNGIALCAGCENEADLDAVGCLLDGAAQDRAAREDAPRIEGSSFEQKPELARGRVD